MECIIDEDDIYSIGEYKVKSNLVSLADSVLVNDASKNHAIIVTTEAEIANIYKGKSIKLEY